MQESLESMVLLGLPEEDFICDLAKKFRFETSLLCGEVQTSPGITYDLVSGFSEEELPSSILLANGLLQDFSNRNDRHQFVELNRGFSSALALRHVLLGKSENYQAFIRGQIPSVSLTQEQFDTMHNEYHLRLNTDSLKIAAIYMAAFNDVGKSLKLLNEASKIKGERVLDHDEANALIVKHPLKRQDLLPGLDRLDDNIKNLVCYSVGLEFNPSCFAQGEYPLYPLIKISNSMSEVPAELQESVLSLIKIETAMDVAGVRGHQAPGGAAYNKFVHPVFDLVFDKLSALVKGKSPVDVYLDYIEENAKKNDLQKIENKHEKIALTRLALMIRSNTAADIGYLAEAYDHLNTQFPELSKLLINELAVNNLTVKNSIWMQYSPDLLRILTKENTSGQKPAQGLLLGLRLYTQILAAARNQSIKSPCYMVQGRDIIPIVRKAASGDSVSLELLENAALNGVIIQDGVVSLKQIKSYEIIFKTINSIGAALKMGIFSTLKNIQLESDEAAQQTEKPKI